MQATEPIASEQNPVPEDFSLALEAYEGPLDLLLHLIAKDEVDVFDITIARITDQYLQYIRLAENFNLNLASEFLVMASTLVEIKSNALLPRDESDDDDEYDDSVSPEDARIALIASLIEYKTFKNIAAEFEARFELEERFYTRHAPRIEMFEVEKNLLSDVEPDELARLLAKVLNRSRPPVVSLAHMKSALYTVEEKIAEVRQYLTRNKRGTFREISRNCQTKLERIVILLALLEMHKEGMLELRQAITFGEIEIVRSGEWREI